MKQWYEMDWMGLDWESSTSPGVNPATGLAMVNDAMDTGGNPFGTDLSDMGSSHDVFGYDSFGTGGFGDIGSDW